MSEFERDLSLPNAAHMRTAAPLLERNPVAFWRWLALLSLFANAVLFFR